MKRTEQTQLRDGSGKHCNAVEYPGHDAAGVQSAAAARIAPQTAASADCALASIRQ